MRAASAIREAAPASRDETAADAAVFRRLAAAVMVLTAVLFFARLGARALWSSEFRWAEIAREMHLTGNYFWPTINGRVYYDKPLLSYWMVLGASWLTGSVNEAAARIPCALAGLAAVAILMALARRLYDLRTAVLAAFILATSMSFVFFSRHASADVETITGELAALLMFLAWRERRDGWWVIGLWLVMAVTSLTKGLLGFVLPILVIGSYSCLADGWKELYDHLASGTLAARWRWLVARNRWFFNWKSIPAIALAAVVYAVPFAISTAKMGSNAGFDKVYRENIVRFFHPFDHRGPVYLYVYVIFALMAPWSALLPAALAQAHRRGQRARAAVDRFALVFFWATFIFFTASGSRRSYYILPILPAGALLVARLLTQPLASLSPAARRLLNLGYAALAIAVAAGAILLIPPTIRPARWRLYPATPDYPVFALFWAAAALAIVYALRRFRPGTIAASFAIVAYLSMTYLYVFAMPAADAYRGEKPFAEDVRTELHGDLSALVFFRTQGPLFYLNPPHPIPEYDTPADLSAVVKSGSAKWIIVRRRDMPMLATPTKLVAAEASFPWEVARDRRNKVVLLKIE